MDGEDIPIDAYSGVVPMLGLFENLASLCIGQMRANGFNVVDVPRNLDGVGGRLRALAHGVSSCCSTAAPLQPMRTRDDGASGRRGCPLPALAAGQIRKGVCAPKPAKGAQRPLSNLGASAPSALA